MIEEIALQLRDKTDELLKELLLYAGIEINEADLRNMAEFKNRLENEGYEIVTWSEEGHSFYKLSRFGEGIMLLEMYVDYNFGGEKNSAKFMYKWTPLR